MQEGSGNEAEGNVEVDDRPSPNRSSSAVRIAKFHKILEADMVKCSFDWHALRSADGR